VHGPASHLSNGYRYLTNFGKQSDNRILLRPSLSATALKLLIKQQILYRKDTAHSLSDVVYAKALKQRKLK